MSPFLLAFTVGCWPRMEAAVAEPCGLVRAGVFLLLLIFFFVVTDEPQIPRDFRLPSPICLQRSKLRVGECIKEKPKYHTYFQNFSALLNTGVGIVIMDAFMIFS